MQPVRTDSSGMVTVARFPNREQAENFCGIAAECGVRARVSDSRRFTAGFDATLGGADSLEGCSVRVTAEEVAVLKAHLEAHLEIDPMDPLHTAGRAELLAMAEGPMDGNLCEQIIAARILANLPPVAVPDIAPDPGFDAYLASDGRMARWLGITGLLFTVVYLLIILNGLGLTPRLPGGRVWSRTAPGLSRTVEIQGEEIANNVRPFLITLIPMGTGAALILSTRQLRGGTSRRMFPQGWRMAGHLLFWLPILLVVGVVGLSLFYGKPRSRERSHHLGGDFSGKNPPGKSSLLASV